MASDFTFETNRTEWLQTCYARSINSGDLAKKALLWFDKYTQELKLDEKELINKLKETSGQPEFYQFLNNFIQFLNNNKLAPRTVNTYFSFVKSYLRSKGFRIYREDVKQFVKYPKIV